MAEAGAISDVVQLLASPVAGVQRAAAGVLLNLSDADSKAVQRACARAGAAAVLLQLLDSRGSSAGAKEVAVVALRQLASSHEAHRRAIMAQPGSISTLQRVLLDAAAPLVTAEAALGVLRHLTFDDHAAAVVPAVPAVLACLRSPHADLVTQAASLLADLARYSADARQAIVSAGGIPALAAVLQGLARQQYSAGQAIRPTAPMAVAMVALRIISRGNPQAAAAAARALSFGLGHTNEHVLADILVTGESKRPEELGLPADWALPGLFPAPFPLQASGYRCVAARQG